MSAFVALLRAVNVGGTGKLPMSDLKDICEELGFASVRTYIASGNVVFLSRKSETAVKAALEKRLEAYAKKPVGVMVRTAAEMAQILADNPFPKAADALAGMRGQRSEQIRLGRREIYIHYGEGVGTSKLVIPAAQTGTARNMNTVATLAKMAADL
jgi:uncharacterized protein (DUF1697 family)